MATGEPCKKCNRCGTLGDLDFNITLFINNLEIPDVEHPPYAGQFAQSLNELMQALKIFNCKNPCCLGPDIAQHAEQAIKNCFVAKMAITFMAAASDGVFKGKANTYMVMKLKNVKVTAKITCNDEDLKEGKGPPSAEVDCNFTSFFSDPGSSF